MRIGVYDSENGRFVLSSFTLAVERRGVELERYDAIPSPEIELPENVVINPGYPFEENYYEKLRKCVASHPETCFLVWTPFREEVTLLEEVGTENPNVEALTILKNGTGRLLDLLA